MAGDTFQQAAAQTAMDAAQFTAWLDAELGRPLTIVALCRTASSDDLPALWREALASYPCVRLVAETLGESSVADALARIALSDPDALLVCEQADAAGEQPGGWRVEVLSVAEERNLFERMLLARYGAGVTRANARKQGYEDGFAPEQPLAEVLATLAREAIGRESYRRRGSSPPCYL
jgi:hypothetical protein